MNKNIVAQKVEVVWRIALLYGISHVIPQYIVMEHPKSGGTWYSQMLAAYLRIPFPQNRMPGLCTSVIHSLYLYNSHLKNVSCVMRDGRDVMVSFYYFCFFENDKFNSHIVKRHRKALPFANYEDIRANLPRFIEFQMTSPVSLHYTWPQFVRSWMTRSNVLLVRYEDLLKDTLGTMILAVETLTGKPVDREHLQKVVDLFSFKSQSGRNPGEENIKSFMRKGISGDWKNHFSPEARKIFQRYAGPELIALGYEVDDTWIDLED